MFAITLSVQYGSKYWGILLTFSDRFYSLGVGFAEPRTSISEEYEPFTFHYILVLVLFTKWLMTNSMKPILASSSQISPKAKKGQSQLSYFCVVLYDSIRAGMKPDV